jgi:predicted branched-subunit amino acid permease
MLEFTVLGLLVVFHKKTAKLAQIAITATATFLILILELLKNTKVCIVVSGTLLLGYVLQHWTEIASIVEHMIRSF